ncbi:PREDICTED: cytochrome P450 708A2-like [Camelina sativa]|uniref:Cytochrome P450 708A2-like n=1 Tax=Camelina sativa TaxID=90675 RepID=A0ABM0YLQ7_CAMSA|nr:PREDICTED: cytochrome P450 708A2-like [Camelina sativa]
MSDLLWITGLCVIALVVVRISHWWYRWSNPKFNGKLPPGSMGFPIIGETFHFYKPHGFYEISPFFKKRMSKYGPLFRTNILGFKTVVSTDKDVNMEILRQENKSFNLSYPDGLVKSLGKESIFFKTGNIHKHIKLISMQLVGSENLKRNILKDMDRVTREHLSLKASQGRFDVRDAVFSMITAHLTPKMISNLKPETQAKLMDNFKAFSFDWFRPSFTLEALKGIYKTLRACRDGMKLLNDVYSKRNASTEKHDDFLNTVMEELEKEGSLVTQDAIVSLIFVLSCVTQELTVKTICFAVKFLSENPKVLAELKREHVGILESREDKEGGVTWEEYRHKMTFTNMVINETLRLANMAPVVFRKAVEDVEINGYTIPAGWVVLVATSVVHFDSEVYENPFEFNPWRWEGKEVRSGSKTFMVFGGGVRQCVGAEFARLQISIFLHHLITTYDFSLFKGSEVIRAPAVFFPEGISINISKCST